ncbi:Z1 domain-containing protein [Priestia filamentosa]|uniref:Z1 domain-containing protein n=1 Tax=Priestia filamentosa TaxID=1402861 RepID=UPI001C1E0BAA|nr:Z1 domain-containing protein [Priestia filamentosa]
MNEQLIRGLFYKGLLKKNDYSPETEKCIFNTLKGLKNKKTTANKPGMLLGKIQSGKTKTFIGITGLAFDNNYDIAIVLTKGTKALTRQTYERLKEEFSSFQAHDKIQIYDIMNLPGNLIQYELNQKLIFVVKKEIHNLKRLHKAFFDQYPLLQDRKILLIDDEADFASVGFLKTKKEAHEIRVIAGEIDQFRKKVDDISFLQVTATPYSLYLQPEQLKIDGSIQEFQPVKPSFTELVPVSDGYIGGEYYFEEGIRKRSLASYLYEAIPSHELAILKKPDRRRFKLEEALTSKRIESLRTALLQFIVGGIIRRLQQRKMRKREMKYSFIVHTEQAKAAHEWQETIVAEMKRKLQQMATEQPLFLYKLIKPLYANLKKSLERIKGEIPTLQDVQHETCFYLKNDYVLVTKVNSEKEISELLDDKGQLKLRAPLNIFIGGQILDRGITVQNLIGFYYGRNPRTFQQDTILQHSRMFGYRLKKDLAVTRFYTTLEIYQVMKKIHEFDTSLRESFEKKSHERGVVFIRRDEDEKLVPCNPNKILLSKTVALKPLKRLLPVGFQTGYKSNIAKHVKEIDQIIERRKREDGKPFLFPLPEAVKVIQKIKLTHDEKEGESWDDAAFLSSLTYLSKNLNSKYSGNVLCIVRENRNMSRIRSNHRYEDAPDTASNEESELMLAKRIAIDTPVLILLRQNGKEENGWRGGPFWWPILVTPKNTKTTIFTGGVSE